MDIQTSTKLDKYNPNVRKNAITRQTKSPAVQETVIAQPEIVYRHDTARCHLTLKIYIFTDFQRHHQERYK